MEFDSLGKKEEITPSTRDLIELIEKMANDGSNSRFFKGHISKSILEEHFLADCEKVVDSTLDINC